MDHTSKKKKEPDILLFISIQESTCDECGEELGSGAWITLIKDKKALCLSCAGMGHLEFLPSGDAAMTLRSRKYSAISAVVLKWSRARKRYERQGLLVEKAAMEKAKEECRADKDIRERRRKWERKKRLASS